MYNLKNIPLVSILIFFFSSCGGGGSDTPPPPSKPTPVVHEVKGLAVKGPLVNAQVNIYAINQNAADFKGTLITSGTTGTRATFQNINITAPLQDMYLVEVVSTEQTIDLNTGVSPLFE